jgi:hypothetical protein
MPLPLSALIQTTILTAPQILWENNTTKLKNAAVAPLILNEKRPRQNFPW